MVIEVTAEDISRGVKGDNNQCPIARAIERIHPNVVDIDVAGYNANWWIGTEELHGCDLPEEAQAFIAAFDKGLTVQPFSFEIEDEVEVQDAEVVCQQQKQ